MDSTISAVRACVGAPCLPACLIDLHYYTYYLDDSCTPHTLLPISRTSISIPHHAHGESRDTIVATATATARTSTNVTHPCRSPPDQRHPQHETAIALSCTTVLSCAGLSATVTGRFPRSRALHWPPYLVLAWSALWSSVSTRMNSDRVFHDAWARRPPVRHAIFLTTAAECGSTLCS